MTKQSKVFISLLSAASLSCMVALTPALAQKAMSLKAQLMRETLQFKETVAPNAKDTAAKAEAIAAKVEAIAAKVEAIAAKAEAIAANEKVNAARIEGVAVLGSKDLLGILAGKLKTTCHENEEHAEFVVQHVLEQALHDQGVKVVDKDASNVCNFRVYIGVDDDDDDNDGIPDAKDKDEFGDADDILGEDNREDVPDLEILNIDMDELTPEVTAALPNTEQDKGIFILLVADKPDRVVVLRTKADALMKVEEASLPPICFTHSTLSSQFFFYPLQFAATTSRVMMGSIGRT